LELAWGPGLREKVIGRACFIGFKVSKRTKIANLDLFGPVHPLPLTKNFASMWFKNLVA